MPYLIGDTCKIFQMDFEYIEFSGLQVNLKPKVPTKTVCDEHLELRKEILTLLNLQKQVNHTKVPYKIYFT